VLLAAAGSVFEPRWPAVVQANTWEATMLREIPRLRLLVQRRRIARLVRETPARTAAEQAAAVRRLIEQSRAER
jgi:hypothetical protein